MLLAAWLGCWVTAEEKRVVPGGGTDIDTDADTDADTDTGTTLPPLEWELIDAGTFEMGCTAGQSDCDEDESPTVTRTLTHDFYAGKYEVTQAQFSARMGYAPSAFAGCGDCPVETVNWHEAVAFANALSMEEGYEPCYSCTGVEARTECEVVGDPYQCEGYRLLTEVEWEFAARCGTDLLYAGSDEIDEVAWYSDNSDETHPVGEKIPNACGLYDMSGNVWEWVQDWYDDYPGDTSDYLNTVSGNYRVLRGGSWLYDPSSARVANRYGNSPGARYNDLGFRLARLQ